MQVTVGAKCWDGSRRKSLSEIVKTEIVKVESTIKKQSFMEKLNRLNVGEISFVPAMLLAAPFISPLKAFAAAPEAVPVIGGAIKEKILHAFDPLIDLIMSLSFPIAGVMIAGGCLFIMTGNRERGMQMLQNAALGYILVQLTPMMLNLLVGIGGSI